MVFEWLRKKLDVSESDDMDKKIVYAPAGLSVQQKGTIIGVSFLGMIGVSYLLDYILYLSFGGVFAGVMLYDNHKIVGFINERKFLSDDLINKFNENTALVAGYLTPAQITAGVTTGVGKGAEAVGSFSWLSQLGLVDSGGGGDSGGSGDSGGGGLDKVATNMAAIKKAM